ncbi:MAG: YdcF family protein [Proteobacteria bacterium]|nr:YdcF family protein [Pseudomonadota bacterium]
MFFFLSKSLALLTQPLFLGLLALLGAWGLRRAQRWRQLRWLCVALAFVTLGLFSCGAIANLLLAPLERAYPRSPALPTAPGAIVLLGGTTDPETLARGPYELNAAADRFVEALRLAQRYPRAVLLISGGSSALLQRTEREADVLAPLARELGVTGSRLRIDNQARNTHENARYSARLLGDVRGPVLLVTSAFHMRRAVACFAKVGLKVVPWPVDYQQVTLSSARNWLPRAIALDRSTMALREYLGLLAYRIAGYL